MTKRERNGTFTGRIWGTLRYLQELQPYHACDHDKASDSKDHHKGNLLPLWKLYSV